MCVEDETESVWVRLSLVLYTHDLTHTVSVSSSTHMV